MKTVDWTKVFSVFPASDCPGFGPPPKREIGWNLKYLTRKELEALARQLLEEKNENS